MQRNSPNRTDHKQPGVQGDVLLQPVDTVPGNARELTEPTIAYGELSGHHHRFKNKDTVQVFEDPEGTRYAEVTDETVLEHDEHDPQTIEPGTYEVRIKREWSEAGERQVQD